MSKPGSVIGADETAPSKVAARSSLFGTRQATPTEAKSPAFPRGKRAEINFDDPTLTRKSSANSAHRSKTDLPSRASLSSPIPSPLLTRSKGSFSSRASVPLAPADSPTTPHDLPRKQSFASEGSARMPSPATPHSVPPEMATRVASVASMGRVASHGSGVGVPKTASQRSATSQHTAAVSQKGSYVSMVSQQQASESGTVPPQINNEAYNDIPDAVSEASSHPSRRSANLADENSQLKSQVESLQRLLQDNSKQNKVANLQKDVHNKAVLISKLQKERDGLTTEVTRLKKRPANSSFRRASSLRRPDSQTLPIQLPPVEPPSQTPSVNGETAAQIADLQESVCTLKQSVAEKAVALKQTELKLDKAQEAIVAGINWEAPIKLDETKRALRSFLRAPSNDLFNPASSASRPRTSATRSATAMHPAAAFPPQPRLPTPSTERSTAVTVFDIVGRRVVFTSSPYGMVKTIDGVEHPPVLNVGYSQVGHCLNDSAGSVRLAPEAASHDVLRMVAAVADASGCTHNLPREGGVEVVGRAGSVGGIGLGVAGLPASPQVMSPAAASRSPSRAVVAAHWLVEERSVSPVRQHSLPPYPNFLH